MSWRPDNWPKIKQALLPLRMESLDPAPFKLIEAGADAILEALQERKDQRIEAIAAELDRIIVQIEGLDDI